MTSISLFPVPGDIPVEHRLSAPVEPRACLLGGKRVEWAGETQDVYSPVYLRSSDSAFTRAIPGRHPLIDPRTALDALDAASQAFRNGRGDWPTMGVEERIRHVEEFVFRMIGTRAEVVRLMMWEIGKSYADSCKEFDRTIDYIRDTIAALKDLDRAGARFDIRDGIFGQIRRAPLGVVLSMGPFNYPLNETFTTLIPALIMGNTVVLKPPKYGVLLFTPLIDAFRDAFPSGVVNIVFGDGRVIIGPMVRTGRIDVLAFIGTSRVADLIRREHPKPHRLRCVLGLEAKNPAIILPDADLDLTVRECLLGSLSFNGQRCTALKVLFVQRTIAEEFTQRLARAVNELKLGMPWDPGVAITPLPEESKPDYLRELIRDAGEHGARVVNEGGGESDRSLFRPAVLYPVQENCRVFHEEQFGPVVPVVPFDEIDEPIRAIEASDYGQQVSLFGLDPAAMVRLIDPLVNQVCRVNLNSQCQRGPDVFPFTGRKDSAEGTLSVSDALRVFSIRTLVAAKDTEMNRRLVTDIIRNRMSRFLSTDFIF